MDNVYVYLHNILILKQKNAKVTVNLIVNHVIMKFVYVLKVIIIILLPFYVNKIAMHLVKNVIMAYVFVH
jgi:hypothetical protein